MKLIQHLSCSPEHVLPFLHKGTQRENKRRRHRWLRLVIVILAALAVLKPVPAIGQDQSTALAERSSIVFLGKVEKVNASDEPMVQASARTAIVSVQKMYAGNEIAGDQTGRDVTVILSRPGVLKAGEEALFYGNPRFLGKSLTIADDAEVRSASRAISAQTTLERGVQARKDKPILDRLATATLVFRGSVEKVEPVAVEAPSEKDARGPAPPTEHDPDWHAAIVRVSALLRGSEAGQLLTVVFPASKDIVWFNVPKLKPGQDALFLVHLRNKQEEPLYRSSGLSKFLEKQTTYLVTQPFDVLPAGEESRVRGLVAAAKEKKQ